MKRALVSTLMLGLSVAGCAVGPNFKLPAPPTVTTYAPEPLPSQTASAPVRGGEAQRFDPGGAVSARWWTLFGSPELDALEDQALKSNPDLAAAHAALRQARELWLAQRGALWPSIGLTAAATPQKGSQTLAPPLANNGFEFTLYNAQVEVSYAPDVFGGVRRQIETAKAQAESQRFQTEAAYLTLTSNVANAAVQAASLQAQIDAAKRIIAANEKTVDIVRRQQEVGQAAGSDVAAAETALAQARQTLPPLEKAQVQERDLLADLTGRFPSDAQAPAIDLDKLALPQDLPVSLPADLVGQRPDVRAAEANLHAASAQVGVAIAARLPSFTIDGVAGGASTSLGQLFSGPNTLWSVAAGATQPLFQGGALMHRQKAAEAAFEEAKAQYRSTVLGACQNVADTLAAVVADARTLEASAAAERAASRSLEIAQRQLALGQVNALTVLNAQQAWAQTLATLTQAKAARFTDTVALYQALGGGWWNRRQSS